MCFYILSKSLCNIAFTERFKYKAKTFKDKYPNTLVSYIGSMLSYFFAALSTSLITYPFDLALTRFCANTETKFKSISSAYDYYNPRFAFNFSARYEGFKPALLESVFYGMVLSIFYSFYKNKIKYENTINTHKEREQTNGSNSSKIEIKSDSQKEGNCNSEFDGIKRRFYYSCLAAIFASVLSYPLNTLTKLSQVNGVNDFSAFDIRKFVKTLGSQEYAILSK